jgi:hypothetical protein
VTPARADFHHPPTFQETILPLSDIEIARQARMRRITELAQDRLGIGEEHLIPYGHYKAKLAMPYVQALADDPQRPKAS